MQFIFVMTPEANKSKQSNNNLDMRYAFTLMNMS